MSQATLGWAAASQAPWPVVVVGAGLAGIVTSLELARRDVRVLLLERKQFPREKVCGGCLNAEAVANLQQLGLQDQLAEIGARPLHNLRLFSGQVHAEIDLPGGLATSRSVLDNALLQVAISAGVSFLPGVDVRIEPQSAAAQFRRLICRHPHGTETVQAAIVVVATGLASEPMSGDPSSHFQVSAGSKVGVQTAFDDTSSAYEPGSIYMAVGREGYVGVTRLEGNRLNIAAAVRLSGVREVGAANVCRRILESCDLGLPDHPTNQHWQGTVALTRSRSASAERLFVVGDAAGYVEPFTGEGMAAAIRSGRAVVPLVQQAVLTGWTAQLGERWKHELNALVTQRQWICRGLSQLLRRPLLVRTAIAVTAQFPAMGRAVARMINGRIAG